MKSYRVKEKAKSRILPGGGGGICPVVPIMAYTRQLHRCSWSKQAPDDKEQKEIDESQFEEHDKHHSRVSEVTEEP